MKKLTCSKLLTSAATVASTAFLASTVAISTATAATFNYTGSADVGRAMGLAIEKVDWTSVEDFDIEALTAEDLRISSSDFSLDWGKFRGMEVRDFWIIGVSGNYANLILGGEKLGGSGVWESYYTSFWVSRFGDFELIEDSSPASSSSERAAVPEPSSAIALGVLGAGLAASRLRRRSK